MQKQLAQKSIRVVVPSCLLLILVFASTGLAQSPPYDNPPEAKPPYFRVRYEASERPGELTFPANYTIWIPPKVEKLRGVIVHQHGCGEGSCKSGQSGAYDVHWQALAKKHDCALLAPSYEQPEGADCQMWCDPRNGSAEKFQQALIDLGEQSGHAELSQVPWALWGHSGGGHWAGGMLMLYPQRVIAVWLRSGVPLFETTPGRNIKPHELAKESLKVPVICNLGTKEGVSDKNGRFAGVWPSNETFFKRMRSAGGLIGVAIDPLTSHECGNQRYLAIPWFDACLELRLSQQFDGPLKELNEKDGWLSPLETDVSRIVRPVNATNFAGDSANASWLPNEAVSKAWYQYVVDTQVTDSSAPPAPANVWLESNQLVWSAEADLESGIAYFIVEKNGQEVARIPKDPKNPFGRALFQGLQYSDTPTVPLVEMKYNIESSSSEDSIDSYSVRTVNTAGLASPNTKVDAESK